MTIVGLSQFSLYLWEDVFLAFVFWYLERSRNGTRHYYYHCKKGCKVRFRADVANLAILQFLRSFTFSPQIISLYQEVIRDIFVTNEGDKEKEIARIDQEVKRIETIMEKAQDRFFEDRIQEDEYNQAKERYRRQLLKLKFERKELEDLDSNFLKYLDFGTTIVQDIDFYYDHASLDTKQKIIGSIFPEKLIYEDKKYRTTKLNDVIRLLCDLKADYGYKKTRQAGKYTSLSKKAPPLGLEPRTY